MFYLVLDLPMRLNDICGAGSAHAGAWALWLGMTGGTAVSAFGVSAFLPDVFFAVVLLLAGAFTGVLAASLSEMIDVLPHMMITFHLEDEQKLLMWGATIGKTAGAFIAVVLGI